MIFLKCGIKYGVSMECVGKCVRYEIDEGRCGERCGEVLGEVWKRVLGCAGGKGRRVGKCVGVWGR